MHDVSAEGVDERMINVHYCYYCVDITNPPPLGNHCACGFYTWLIVCGITSKSAVKSVQFIKSCSRL